MSVAGHLRRVLGIEAAETRAALLGFALFFALLASFAGLRPVRDAMGIASGLQNLPWLFSGTLAAMLLAVPLFGWLTTRVPRRVFIPVVYRAFALQALVFYVLFALRIGVVATASAFFIWVSVYNVFVVSVFWSFMADLFSTEQAKRLYGVFAAGGTIGMIAGPFAAIVIAQTAGAASLLVLTAAFLEIAVQCVHGLNRWSRRRPELERGQAEAPVPGRILQGMLMVVRSPYLAALAVHVFLYSLTSTFLYVEQQQLVRAAAHETAAQTVILARLDLGTQVLALLIQTLVTGRILHRLGLGFALALLPMVTLLGAAAITVAPSLSALLVVQAIRRASQYAVERPGREAIYTRLGRDVKYRTKNVLDTVVFRGGDAITAWAHAGLAAAGLGVVGIAGLLVPLSAAWAGLATWLGRTPRPIDHPPAPPPRPHRIASRQQEMT